MKIAVIGTGYVGLVSGACFAEFGLEVTCADIDQSKIDTLNGGQVPFYEPGLLEKIEHGRRENRISFTTDVGGAISGSQVVFIAVGTPANRDGSTNLSAIDSVASDIGEHLNSYKVIATKSTVPPRTGERIRSIIEERVGSSGEFDVVSNPEFLREGSAIEDFMRPDRIVIGAESDRAVEIMKELYGPLYLIETPFVVTNVATAEMIKYASNAFLATKIMFINEIANLCEPVGADVHQVARAMGLDGRISSKFLHPGPGFGGSCFPKDVSSLVATAREHDYEFLIGEAALEANRRQRALMVQKIARAVGDLEGKRVAMLGLSFKPNTDDMRDSPTIDIVRGLVDGGAEVHAYDPAAMDNARHVFGDSIHYAAGTYEACHEADVVVIATEWNQFRNLDLERLRGMVRAPIMVDLRNVYRRRRVTEAGFEYHAVGR